MNPRLIKEFRPLLMPWSVAALAATGYLVKLEDPVFARGEFGGFIQGFAVFAFGFGCLLLAVLPFGLELQHRTLPLLVGQPIERSRVWLEKLLVSAAAVLALGVIHFAALYAAARGDLTLRPLPLCAALVVVTICSGAYCTLATRSIIGGITTSACIQFLIVLLVSYVIYRVLGREADPVEWPVTFVYVGVGAVYSAFVLWLGWRTFAAFEVREGPGSPNLALPRWVTRRGAWTTLFHCQPTGALRNLIRKEIGLQNPVFLIALVFSACWLVALVAFVLQPERQELLQGIFGGLTGAYVPIVVLLTPCVAFGEEKTLGLAAWHLTLPVSARRQWLLKLSAAWTTALLVGVVLPLVLACLTLAQVKVGLVALPPEMIWPIASVLIIAFVLGVWCASLWGSTLRSAVATLLSILGLATCANLGGLAASHFDGLQTNLVRILPAWFQLPPDFLLRDTRMFTFESPLAILASLVVALVQSLAQYRRGQTQSKVTLKYVSILVLLTFAGSFWCSDLIRSIGLRLNREVLTALASVPKEEWKTTRTQGYSAAQGTFDMKSSLVTYQQLVQSGKLSDDLKRKMNGCLITIVPVSTQVHKTGARRLLGYSVRLLMPDDKHHLITRDTVLLRPDFVSSLQSREKAP
jgi:hypothetical protein